MWCTLALGVEHFLKRNSGRSSIFVDLLSTRHFLCGLQKWVCCHKWRRDHRPCRHWVVGFDWYCMEYPKLRYRGKKVAEINGKSFFARRWWPKERSQKWKHHQWWLNKKSYTMMTKQVSPGVLGVLWSRFHPGTVSEPRFPLSRSWSFPPCVG